MHSAEAVLSAASPTYSLRQDDLDYILFCFAKPEGAEAFCERFGGERLVARFNEFERILRFAPFATMAREAIVVGKEIAVK